MLGRGHLAMLLVASALWLVGGMHWATAQEPEYRLGTGDKIRVIVFGHDDLSGEFEVDGRGSVSLPLIGETPLAGRTLEEAELLITNRLKPDYLKNPRVSIAVLNYRPFYIIGEVIKPGSYPYVNGMRVTNAIALAGGYTYRAREDKVYIKRGQAEEIAVDISKDQALVLPGDIIRVPERYF